MKQIINKIQLSSKEILNHFIVGYRPQWNVISNKYDQINVDKSITNLVPTEIINQYSDSINMFLGANCSNNDKLDFNAANYLFLSGKQYSKDNLQKLNINFDFDCVPNIDLSNNNFGSYNFIWDFGTFLNQIYNNVYLYVYPSFSHELKAAIIEDEEEFNTYGTFNGNASVCY